MIERLVFILSSAIFLFGISFSFGLYTGAKRTILYYFFASVRDQIQIVWNEQPNITATRPTHWVDRRRFPGEGVVVNRLSDSDGDLVLLQGFFDGGLEVRLIKRDGQPVRRWRISGSELIQGISHIRNAPKTDWNFDTHGVVALPDGAIVFNLDHVGLFKLDKCGKLSWRIDRATHHSVELNQDGTFWVSASRKYYEGDLPSHPLFSTPYAEDVLMKVSAEGDILREISLIDVFFASGKVGLLTLTGSIVPDTLPAFRYDFSREIFHLNDVEELSADLARDFSSFKAGDLLVSLRNRNLLLILDPETGLIKWWHIGEWVRQHDPDWNAGGAISVFDNNRDKTRTGEILGSSRIVQIEPDSNTFRVVYGLGDDEFFHSTRRGKHQFLDDGRLVITDAEAGRVIEVDRSNNIVWEYVNGFDEDYTVRISEARVYKRGYFSVQNWNCMGES